MEEITKNSHGEGGHRRKKQTATKYIGGISLVPWLQYFAGIRSRKAVYQMKLRQTGGCIELTNMPKTVVGIVCAIAFPVLCAVIACDFMKSSPDDIDWTIIVVFIITIPAYLLWLIRDFRATVLHYKIQIDERGVQEKRLLGKDRSILWKEMDSYVCEVTAAPYRTSEKFLQITFYAVDHQSSIRTWSFPESKQHEYRDNIFGLCDTYDTGS